MQRKLQFITKNSGTDMVIYLLHFTSLFFQGEDNSIERGKTIIIRGMWRVSVMQMRRSVLSTPVAGSVTSHTVRVVFLYLSI